MTGTGGSVLFILIFYVSLEKCMLLGMFHYSVWHVLALLCQIYTCVIPGEWILIIFDIAVGISLYMKA